MSVSETKTNETNRDSEIQSCKIQKFEKIDREGMIPPSIKPLRLKILKPPIIENIDSNIKSDKDGKRGDVIKIDSQSQTENYKTEGSEQAMSPSRINPLQLKISKSPTIENRILMYDGTTKRDIDIKVGDVLMGTDSQRNVVTQIQYIEELCYKITPIKGDSYFVGESDILSLTYSTNPTKTWREEKKDFSITWFDNIRNEKSCKTFSVKNYGDKEKANDAAEKFKDNVSTDNYFDISIKDFLTKPPHYQQFSKTYREGFDFPHTEFKFDPYIIGFWLGDGTEAVPEITTADPEIVSYLREYFARFNLHVTRYGGENGIKYRISSGLKNGIDGRNSFLNYLKDENLIKNKHIPLKFMMTSRENRLRLLAGLLDSDGSLDKNCYDFIQKRERLFDEFIFLCRSLGFACYKQPCVKICTNAPNGPKPGNYFRCQVSGEGLEEIPTILNRKKAAVRKLNKRVNISGIQIENIGIQTYIRIITEQPKYLLHDFTVRHKYDILREEKAIKLKTLNNQSYGYKRDVNDPNGLAVCIDEKEAEVIRMLFFFQKIGLSQTKIAEEMNKLGIKTQNGKLWNYSNVKNILKKKLIYMGGERNVGDIMLRYPAILDETMI